MINPITFKSSVAYNKKVEQNSPETSPNPLRLKTNLASLTALSNYSQALHKPKIDVDTLNVLQNVRLLNSFAPQKFNLPYSYNFNEINGDRIYNSQGKILCIKQEHVNTVKYYYPDKNTDDNKTSVYAIEEYDKENGNLQAKYEPVRKPDGSIKTKITIFDDKFNGKYTMFQVEEDGLVRTITDFSSDGASFRTLYRNTETMLPERYIESNETNAEDFSLVDCKFDKAGNISELKNLNSSKEVTIRYEGNTKTVSVKSFESSK